MANALYTIAKESFLSGAIDWLSDTIKAVLIDIDDFGLTIIGASNTTPITIETSSAHGYITDQRVGISGVQGNTAANNTTTNTSWYINVTSPTEFELVDSIGNGAYTSGGYVVDLAQQYISDIPVGARVATSGAMSGKSVTGGIAKADNVVLLLVVGDVCEGILVYKDTGVEATSPLIAFINNAIGLPVTPGGGNINIVWDSVNGVFRI